MAKKCKDCDPNKYIEGVSWRGKNGISYDGYTIYNDVGKPSSTDITLADVADLVDAYNPILSASTTYPNPLPESSNNQVNIDGVDRGNGFWFVWSLVNGLVMYGTPGVNPTPSAILSSATTTAMVGMPFSFNVQLEQVVSSLNYTDFGILADLNSNDRLRFAGANSTIIELKKDRINYVGYYTGIIESILNGNRYISVGSGKNKTTQLETFKASKSLTIKSTDQYGNDPIYVNSAPTIHAFRGQAFSYNLTTNLPSNQYSASLDGSSLNILQNLGLVWNPNTKTITGTVSLNVGADIKTATLSFKIYGPNSDAGNRKDFNLSIVKWAQKTTDVLPTITAKTFTGTVGTAIGNQSLAGLNNKHTILS